LVVAGRCLLPWLAVDVIADDHHGALDGEATDAFPLFG
jgi:hypothetical protein